jgi:hypothetical protein
MCDYSLMSIPNRIAREGEQLMTYRFPTGAMGLASPADLPAPPVQLALGPRAFWSVLKEAFASPKAAPVPAVCIPPGAWLLLHDIPESLQREIGVGPAEAVTFTQITATSYSYRDAVHFRNGREILLQRLREGQRVLVRDLSSAEAAHPARELLALER